MLEHYIFPNQASIQFRDAGAVHRSDDTIYIELAGSDEYRGRRYIKIKCRDPQEAQAALREYLVKLDQWQKAS